MGAGPAMLDVFNFALTSHYYSPKVRVEYAQQ
jgi:hypothetical protein